MKLLFLLCLSLSSFGARTELVEVVREGVSKQANPVKAKNEILSSVSEKIALEKIEEILGKEKLNQNRSLIGSSVLSKKDRFMPILKGGVPVRIDGVTKMEVRVTYSPKDLLTILKNEGFFNQNEGPASVLPMFIVFDEVQSQSYKWWFGDDNLGAGFVKSQMRVLVSQLKKSLRDKGFYLLNPIKWRSSEWITETIRRDSYRRQDYMAIGEYLGAQVVIYGRVRFFKDKKQMNRNEVEYRLTAINTNNGRVVGEVIRKFPSEAGQFETVVAQAIKSTVEEIGNDLASQVLLAWQEGTLSGQRVRVSLIGKLSYQQVEQLKRELPVKIKGVQNLKERYFSNNKVTLEVECSVSPRELAKRLKNYEVAGLRLSSPDVSSEEVSLKVRKIR